MNRARVTFAEQRDGMGRKLSHDDEVIEADHLYVDYAAQFVTVVAFDKAEDGSLVQPANRMLVYPAHVLVRIDLERDLPEPAPAAKPSGSGGAAASPVTGPVTAPAAAAAPGGTFDPDEIPF